jgi:hypothetical protein
MAGRLRRKTAVSEMSGLPPTRDEADPERFYLRMPSFVITDLYRSESYFLR